MGRHPFVERFGFSTGFVRAVKDKFDLAALDHDALYRSANGFQCIQTASYICLPEISRTLRHCLNPLLTSPASSPFLTPANFLVIMILPLRSGESASAMEGQCLPENCGIARVGDKLITRANKKIFTGEVQTAAALAFCDATHHLN
jgi:hypothetical protein